MEKSRVNGKYFHEKLEPLYDHPSVGDIRGKGIFAGIEFVQDKDSKAPFDPSLQFNRRVVEQCYENGLLVYPGSGTVDGVRGDHIQVAPPLVVNKEEIDEIVELLNKSITAVEESLH